MIAVLSAQFLSAMADNALLFGALALLKSEHYPDWAAPLLQEFFVGAFILLAPFAGPFADSVPKGRVMLISNGLKLAGVLGMWAGLNPFLAYGLVGIGAAAYSPAKYGILSELTSADQLVKANSLIESSTIAAILVGAIAGGMLADWSVLRRARRSDRHLCGSGRRQPVHSAPAAGSLARRLFTPQPAS
jgi:LPLT family lysophospholipid transporter-like MFS transporter